MEKVFYTKIHNHQVFCILRTPPKPSKRLVIMSHGFRGSSVGPARTFVNFSKFLNQRGINTLCFDQPGCGNSTGDFIDSSFTQWIETIRVLAKTYLARGYQVVLLGQSMGATATMAAAATPNLRQRIPGLIIWVPDPKSAFSCNPRQLLEEAGQKFHARFWAEARDSNFFKCLDQYPGRIHLVYGEHDHYIDFSHRQSLIKAIRQRGDEALILPKQDHSSWGYDAAQSVYRTESRYLKMLFK